VVTILTRAAMPVFLWHQSALIVTTVAVAWLTPGARVPGLHTAPLDPGWLAARLVWLPVFAVVLVLLAERVGGLHPVGLSSGGRRGGVTSPAVPFRPDDQWR
jgi:hypothetical protein